MARSLYVQKQYIRLVKSSLVRNGFARQQDLAEDLGLSRDTISRFFNGKPVGYLNFLEISGRLALNIQEISNLGTINPIISGNNTDFKIKHNLSQYDYNKFIGRKEELEELLKCISPEYRQHITVVEGIGGIGKTALAIEAAHHCLKPNSNLELDISHFDAIIFTSAKENYLRPYGILKRPIREENLTQIFSKIADVLDAPFIKQVKADSSNRTQLVYDTLAKYNCLLIVDNMETINSEDKKEILAFLSDLPIGTQAIITTREKIILHNSLILDALSKINSFKLIKQQAIEKIIKINNNQCRKLYDCFGGVPLALIYAVGQRASGYSFDRITNCENLNRNDMARFCFDGSVNPLKEENKPAYKLLMSIAIFPNSSVKKAIAEVAGINDSLTIDTGLAKLQQLSLIREQEGRYKILSLTREYALAELNANPEFKKQAYKRWVSWYINFTKKYGGKDWEGWRTNYDDYLNPEWDNINGVLNWCADRNRYDDFKELWVNVDTYIDIEGYWRTRRQRWTWLIDKSKQKGDLTTYVQASSEKSWTLSLVPGDNSKETYDLLSEAWKLRHEADDETKVSLTIHFAVFYMGKRFNEGAKPLNEAIKYLDLAKDFLQESNLNSRMIARSEMFINYYYGEIYYWQWNLQENKQDLNNLNKAQIIFEDIIDRGKKIGWQRFTNYAQNWLADILIHQGELARAEEFLISGLFVAEQNKETRRIGHYKATYARLEQARNNQEKACEYGRQALEVFNKEEIRIDAEEMQQLLREVKCEELE